MAHIAIASLVIAKNEEGSDVYIYAGQPVPSNVPKTELDRLVDGEFIAVQESPTESPKRAYNKRAKDDEVAE